MTGFEPGSSVGSDHATDSATNTAHDKKFSAVCCVVKNVSKMMPSQTVNVNLDEICDF